MANKLCTIIGAGEGLGKSLARKFAENGFDLALLSRTEEGCSAAMNSAKNANTDISVQYFEADATDPDSLEKTVKAVSRKMGCIDLLIYNVRGNFESAEPQDIQYDEMIENFRLEVVGGLAAAKAVLPDMRERGEGRLFYSSATAAYRGSASHGLYSIGKFGLRALSQSLAKAYSKDGVHVAHFRLDCDLDMPMMRAYYGEHYVDGMLANPDDIAETYWLAYQQPKGAWSNEFEIRPFSENWTY